MADCSTVEEALHADALGFDFIGTTLVGYTRQSEGSKIEENDFENHSEHRKSGKTSRDRGRKYQYTGKKPDG